ncbi:MAG: TonB-dependent receptor plug domain-containing protein [Limisphaerales bacterium]
MVFNARNDTFVDGVRDFGGYSRDPFNLESVEVAKGPSSSTGGRGSTGGSVNLVSKSPKAESFYEGTFGLGTDESKRATIDLNQSLDRGGKRRHPRHGGPSQRHVDGRRRGGARHGE